MTEQEARDKAEQLTRVWSHGQTVDWYRGTDAEDGLSFGFRAMLTEHACLTCVQVRAFPGLAFRLSPRPQEATALLVDSLCCRSETGEIVEVYRNKTYPVEADFAQFVAQWTDVFRRGCWLCGCPIECSAHEQLEWMLWLQEKEAVQ